MEVQSFGKRGIHYGEQEHDPRGRPGEAEQRGCDLQSARGILYQSDRGAGDWKNFRAGLQYDPGCDKAVCGIDVCRKKFKDGYSGDREGDPGAVFCADAKASDRVYEGCVQPVPHGDRGKPRKIIVQMRKQENRIFNIIKPEFSSGCFFLVFQETD